MPSEESTRCSADPVALAFRWHELPLLWLWIRLRRVSHDTLAGAGCGERLDRAFHPIVLAVALLRGNLVVIGRLCLQTRHAHAKNGIGMFSVDADLTTRILPQELGFRTALHHSEMI